MSAPPSGPLACFGIVHAESSEQRDAALATLAGLLASGEEDEPFQQLSHGSVGCEEGKPVQLHSLMTTLVQL